jgi:hypothetical protein
MYMYLQAASSALSPSTFPQCFVAHGFALQLCCSFSLQISLHENMLFHQYRSSKSFSRQQDQSMILCPAFFKPSFLPLFDGVKTCQTTPKNKCASNDGRELCQANSGTPPLQQPGCIPCGLALDPVWIYEPKHDKSKMGMFTKLPRSGWRGHSNMLFSLDRL